MQIWDTAGQERFRNITKTYYKGASGILLTYAINDRQSFSSIDSWIQQVQSTVGDDVCMILVGTKADLEDQRQVTYQ